MIRWNADKHYLKEIQDAGFPVIPSLFLEKTVDFEKLFRDLGVDRIIIKPCISGGSKNTLTLTKDNPEGRDKSSEWEASEDFLAQPFIKEFHQGETCMLFFNGRFSHCIVKQAKEGDFRVQPQYGGTIRAHIPETAHIRQAEKLLERFAKKAFYARVDGVLIDGIFTLMEVELIEPLLYLAYAADSFANYTGALKTYLTHP